MVLGRVQVDLAKASSRDPLKRDANDGKGKNSEDLEKKFGKRANDTRQLSCSTLIDSV